MASETVSHVARELRSMLAPETFAPRPKRALWLLVHMAIAAVGFFALSALELGAFRWVFVFTNGLAFAGLSFVAHETLHGATVRSGKLRRIVGFFGFLPFSISPRLWMAWHNRVHHNHTGEFTADPDAYPTLDDYLKDARVRAVVETASPGLGRLRGLLTHFIGFSVQSAHMLLIAEREHFLSKKQYRLALLETAGALAFWIGVCALVGPGAFFFGFAIPLLIGNAVVMSFIVTNHSLNSLGGARDPLDTSMSVSVPRLIDIYTLGFGYHVEHHLFPTMSHGEGKKVQALLKKLYPDRYFCLPLGRALWLIHHTPRVYQNAHVLVDPKTGFTVPTLPELLTNPLARPQSLAG